MIFLRGGFITQLDFLHWRTGLVISQVVNIRIVVFLKAIVCHETSMVHMNVRVTPSAVYIIM